MPFASVNPAVPFVKTRFVNPDQPVVKLVVASICIDGFGKPIKLAINPPFENETSVHVGGKMSL